MKKTKAFCLVAVLAVSALLLSTVNAWAVSEEVQRHFDRGVAAVEMAKSPDDYEPAIKEFEQAVRLAPGWADVYYNLGMVQEKAGKYSDAITSLKQYLRLAPNASDAATVKSLINKLEFKAENVLTVADIIDVLVSFSDSNQWQKEEECGGIPRDKLSFEREGSGTVKVLQTWLSNHDHDLDRKTYQTLKITGPVLKYIITINEVVGGAPNRQLGNRTYVIEIEAEVVSKRLVKVNQKLLSTPSRAYTVGQRWLCTFQKKGSADIKAKDKSGLTLLHSVAFHDSKETAEQLIAKGADINAKNESGDTPLQYAVSGNKTEMAELLIAKGADINAKDQYGNTPLDRAVSGGSKEIEELLRKHGAR